MADNGTLLAYIFFQPTKWGNAFFKNLVSYNYEIGRGPGGHWEWKVGFMMMGFKFHSDL